MAGRSAVTARMAARWEWGASGACWGGGACFVGGCGCGGLLAQFPAPLKKRGCAPAFIGRRGPLSTSSRSRRPFKPADRTSWGCRAWAFDGRGPRFRDAAWAFDGRPGLAGARDVGWPRRGTWAGKGAREPGLSGGAGTWAFKGAWNLGRNGVDLGFQGARGTAREAPPGLWTPDNLGLPTPARAEPAAGHGGFPPTVGHPRSRPSPPAVGQSRAQRNRGTLTSVWARSLGEGSVHSAPAAVVLGRAPLVHPAEWMT